MTIFILGSVFETAEKLDVKRFNKQILECQWIINMQSGITKPSNHPAYLMYKDHIEWVKLYQETLKAYKNKEYDKAKQLSDEAEKIKPSFLCDELYLNFKKRLYDKDKIFYKEWENLGESKANFYFVNNTWLKYENGTKTEVTEII